MNQQQFNLILEKQILRDIAAIILRNIGDIKGQSAAMSLTPVANAVDEITAQAKNLEIIAK